MLQDTGWFFLWIDPQLATGFVPGLSEEAQGDTASQGVEAWIFMEAIYGPKKVIW